MFQAGKGADAGYSSRVCRSVASGRVRVCACSVTTPTNRHDPKHRRRPLPIPAVLNGAANARADLLGLVVAE